MKNLVLFGILLFNSGIILAQYGEEPCKPGEEFFAPVPGTVLDQDWASTVGERAYTSQIIISHTQLITGIQYYNGIGSAECQIALYDASGQLLTDNFSDILYLDSDNFETGFSQVFAPFDNGQVIQAYPGDIFYACVTFAGSDSWNLLKDDTFADETFCFSFAKQWSPAWPQDIPTMSMFVYQTTFSISLHTENCEGCTQLGADNYNPDFSVPVLFGELHGCTWSEDQCERADCIRDGQVNVDDLLELVGIFSQTYPYGTVADQNGDTKIDTFELLKLLECLGSVVPLPPPADPDPE